VQDVQTPEPPRSDDFTGKSVLHRRQGSPTQGRGWPYRPEAGSNAGDDGMRSVLESRTGDLVLIELASFIHDLNDEQVDLVALAWLGRGDGDVGDWHELRAEAARAHNKRTDVYLLGKPMLAD
jgi:hypothetical protein